jgi:hypothetical protein
MIILNRSYLQKHDGATSRAGTLVLWIVVCTTTHSNISRCFFFIRVVETILMNVIYYVSEYLD